MNYREKFLQAINLFINRVYIPRELHAMKRPILMHISDTPEEIYPYLYQVIKELKPEYLIHTGDLVDNIKLEILPQLEADYQKSLEEFIENIEANNIQKIYYISGNHDQIEKIKSLTKSGEVLREGVVEIEGRKFYLNHRFIEKKPAADYYLYGHSFEPQSKHVDGEIRLNGLEAMSVISLKNQEIRTLPYPLGTNGFRKMDRNYQGL